MDELETNRETSATFSGTEGRSDLLRGEIIEVEQEGGTTQVELIPAAKIAEMAELDSRVFGEHKSLSAKDLAKINQHGALLAIRDESGTMVAEAQVITEAIADADEPLVRVLPEDSGYREGSGVAPDFRGGVMGVALARAAETVIRREGKQDAWATVRVENAPSIRNLTKEGYVIIGYSQQYYESDDLSGARLVVRKDLQDRSDPELALKQAAFESVTMYPGEPIGEEVASVRIPFQAGDQTDPSAHQMIKEALDIGFIGVGVVREGDISVMVFQRAQNYGDADIQQRLSERQEFLHRKSIA